MKRMLVLPCVMLVFLLSCDIALQSGTDQGAAGLSMDLSRAKVLGYVVTGIHVTLIHSMTGTTIECDLTVDSASERATGTVRDLRVGLWDIVVELSDSAGVFATGTGSVTIVKDITVQAVIHMELDTGDVEIIVDWGDLPTADPVAWYPFDGTADDASGNGRNGSVFGATLAEDRFGNAGSAFLFDGLDDYILLTGSADLEFPAMTVCAWARDDSPSLDHIQKMIVAKHVSTVHKGYCLYTMYRKYYFYVGHESPIDDSKDVISTASDSLWHFVVAVYDNGAMSIYVDGLLAGSDTITGMTHSPAEVTVGSLSAGGPWMHYWQGMIDDIRFYDRALEDWEIHALYHEAGWQGQ